MDIFFNQHNLTQLGWWIDGTDVSSSSLQSLWAKCSYWPLLSGLNSVTCSGQWKLANKTQAVLKTPMNWCLLSCFSCSLAMNMWTSLGWPAEGMWETHRGRLSFPSCSHPRLASPLVMCSWYQLHKWGKGFTLWASTEAHLDQQNLPANP